MVAKPTNILEIEPIRKRVPSIADSLLAMFAKPNFQPTQVDYFVLQQQWRRE